MSTGNFSAGDNPFNDWHPSEIRSYRIIFSARMNGGETATGFGVWLPTDFSAIATGTANLSTTAEITMRLSAKNTLVTGSGYAISAYMKTNSGNNYIETFKVWTYGGHA